MPSLVITYQPSGRRTRYVFPPALWAALHRIAAKRAEGKAEAYRADQRPRLPIAEYLESSRFWHRYYLWNRIGNLPVSLRQPRREAVESFLISAFLAKPTRKPVKTSAGRVAPAEAFASLRYYWQVMGWISTEIEEHGTDEPAAKRLTRNLAADPGERFGAGMETV